MAQKTIVKNWFNNASKKLEAGLYTTQAVDSFELYHLDGTKIIFNEFCVVNRKGLPLVPVECAMLDQFLKKRAKH